MFAFFWFLGGRGGGGEGLGAGMGGLGGKGLGGLTFSSLVPAGQRFQLAQDLDLILFLSKHPSTSIGLPALAQSLSVIIKRVCFWLAGV